MLRCFIKSSLEQCINDNGLGDACRDHLDCMVDHVMNGIIMAASERSPDTDFSMNQSFGDAPVAPQESGSRPPA